VPWGSDAAAVVTRGDVVVEFSAPGAAAAVATLCAERGASLVSGTTGLGEAEEAALREAARTVAVVRAANFSLGVLALRRALAAALAALPESWDVEIVERHHRGKRDAPSGTALRLARDAAEQRGYPESALRSGRSGAAGPRPGAEIGLHSLRGGTWVGDHAVVLAGAGEWLELRHVAEDRGAFAHGVLAAARFVARARPGFYTLEDVAGAARS
jgi:4-hydroxy-tetrahydrodipicolinate reductase